MKKIGIIGTGIAGMSAAIHLRLAGHDVTAFEANSYPGGKLTAFDQDGYRFDAGPSLFTMPQFLEEIFAAAGKNPRDYFEYIKVDPGCHYFWEDGTHFEAPSNPDEFASQAEATFGTSREQVKKYIEDSLELYDITEDVFLKNSLHKASTYLKLSTAKSFAQLHKAHLFTTMNAVNEKKLEHPKLIQFFNRYATYNGSNPYSAPGTLTVVPSLEFRWGTFLPKGGMHQITLSLFKLAKDIGVKFRFEEKAERIATSENGVNGLTTTKGQYDFDTIVSNMDVVPTYRRLLPDHDIPGRVEKLERSSSALIFYWGIEKEFDRLGLHNIFWSEDYQEEFSHLFDKKKIFHDPTVYVNITSKHEGDDAPAGCENWFVMVNAPHVAGQDWKKTERETRKNILEKLSRMLGTNVEPLIKTERVLNPPTIESQTSSYLGSLYGTSSNDRMSAFLRHPNFTNKIKNLYFCGGSVHPGGGIPLCLLSGKIVSDLAS
ncbi:MAG TPA: 1-hydroxycarotenoid 3,4-desaturase CrtD [Cryomorphaceae bacterium]|nr:1-hydroxycarotenoid 3,4-desaturase CrtD [Cryomorphaceae bacterium]